MLGNALAALNVDPTTYSELLPPSQPRRENVRDTSLFEATARRGLLGSHTVSQENHKGAAGSGSGTWMSLIMHYDRLERLVTVTNSGRLDHGISRLSAVPG